MLIATAGSRTSKRWKTEDLQWTELVDRLRTPKRTGETFAEYRAMSKDEKSQRKDVGGFVGGELIGRERKKGGVKNRCLVTLDADTASFDDVSDFSFAHSYAFCVYSTHSHTSEHPRLRWVLPLDRAVTAEQYEPIARRVAQWVGINTLDRSTFEDWRLMFWPSCSTDAPFYFYEQTGDTICADEVLDSYCTDEELQRGIEGWRDISRWPISDSETEVVRRELKRQADPTTKRGIVGAFCRLYDVPAAIDTFALPYEQCDVPNRYTYTEGSTAAGAVLYGDGAWLYSNHATDPAGGLLCNAFDLVRIHKFADRDDGVRSDCAAEKLPSYVAMCEWASGLDEVKSAMIREKTERANADFCDLNRADTQDNLGGLDCTDGAWEDGSGSRVGAEEGDGGDAWQTKLKTNPKTGEIENTLNNAVLLLENLPEFKGRIGYNPMADVITVSDKLPWWTESNGHDELAELVYGEEGDPYADDALVDNVVTDADGTQHHTVAGERYWSELDYPQYYRHMEHYGFFTKGKDNGLLENALRIVAVNNTYHPIKSYLKSLKWDGVERLDTMFVRWLGAQDTRLDRTITRYWMIAAIDRIMRPGCQFEEVLITCGPQGIGKTKLLRTLALGFYTNAIKDMDMSKQTAELLQGVWIVEIGELDAMRKAETTQMKNFISSTTDRYRAAFARAAMTHNRQCVFAGTSNQGSFLRDDTGERRYWIMPVTGIGDNGELVGFREEVDQLWAEAYRAWQERVKECRRPGEKLADVGLYLYLGKDKELAEQMELRRAGYKLPEDDRDDVIGYLDTLRPRNWYEMSPEARYEFFHGGYLGDMDECDLRVDCVSIKEITYELFGDRQTQNGGRGGDTYRVADILDSLPGWKKKGKKRVRGYADWPRTVWVRELEDDEAEEDDDILS